MSRVVWDSVAEAGSVNGRYVLEILDLNHVLDWRPVFRSHSFDDVVEKARDEGGTWRIVDTSGGYGVKQ